MSTDRTPSDDVIPPPFLCPITHQIMSDPHLTLTGHTYEKYAIQQWLGSHDRDPFTNEALTNKMLIPNHALRHQIQSFLAKHPNLKVNTNAEQVAAARSQNRNHNRNPNPPVDNEAMHHDQILDEMLAYELMYGTDEERDEEQPEYLYEYEEQQYEEEHEDIDYRDYMNAYEELIEDQADHYDDEDPYDANPYDEEDEDDDDDEDDDLAHNQYFDDQDESSQEEEYPHNEYYEGDPHNMDEEDEYNNVMDAMQEIDHEEYQHAYYQDLIQDAQELIQDVAELVMDQDDMNEHNEENNAYHDGYGPGCDDYDQYNEQYSDEYDAY